MTSELLSGPDLGAGFLHQLSLEREGERTSLTYHAQDGGTDANGPPKGPLDVLGFVHPTSPCMFGGPRCWHRRFLLPFAGVPGVRRAYNRNRYVLQTMIDQVYDHHPVAIESALAEVVKRISAPLAQEGIEWYVGGSTAAWSLGARIAPHDIDLGTTRAGVDRIAALLGEYLIEPLAPTDWPGVGIVHGARAFVGTFQEGARVEWAVPIGPRERLSMDEWSGRAGEVRTLETTFRGPTLRVTRPEYTLVRAAEKRRAAEMEAILAIVRQIGPDQELLDVLLSRSELPDTERKEFRKRALGSSSG